MRAFGAPVNWGASSPPFGGVTCKGHAADENYSGGLFLLVIVLGLSLLLLLDDWLLGSRCWCGYFR
jgi:hypothetical protein